MTKRKSWLGPLVAGLLVATANAANAVESYELLFAGQIGQISESDMKSIASTLGYRVAEENSSLDDQEGCGPIDHEVRIFDLNEDRVPEVLVIAGNACTSGNVGSSIFLFVKGKAGRYEKNLGIPAFDIKPLSSRSMKYPDLLLGGPGFCHPVWHWKGENYGYKCSYEEKTGACTAARVTTLCSR